MGVFIVNKKELSDKELSTIEEYSSKFYEKIAGSIYASSKPEPKLLITVKKHARKPSENMKCKYSIHTKLEAPSIILAAHESEWDLKKALNKTFENMRHEMEHKFKDASAKAKRTRNLSRK